MKIFWFFQPHTGQDSPQQDPANRGARWVLWITALALLVLVVWAYFSHIDQISRAPGSVIASSRTQIIQSQDGGTLEELKVSEGETVEPGQVLARIERTRAESAYLETRAKAGGLAATIARLNAELFDTDIRFDAASKAYPDFREGQMALFRKRRAALQDELNALTAMKALAQQELEMNLPLLASGDVSRTEVLRLQRQVADLQAQATNRRNKFFQDAQAELSRAQEELAGVEQTLTQRKNQLAQTELRAPLRGVVKNVRITTQGGVIRAGEEVMQIVPLEDDLVIEAKVSPGDIAFLKLGRAANVKIDAYDYTIYGDLPGKLIFISADTLNEDLRQGEQPYYRVRVRTTGRSFSARPNETLEILPGMTATLEIKTGRRSVLQYMIKPVI